MPEPGKPSPPVSISYGSGIPVPALRDLPVDEASGTGQDRPDVERFPESDQPDIGWTSLSLLFLPAAILRSSADVKPERSGSGPNSDAPGSYPGSGSYG